MEKITKDSKWGMNSNGPCIWLKYSEMNDGHLANVFQLNMERLQERGFGSTPMEIISVISEIALERKLGSIFMTTHQPYDADKPYRKHGEKKIEFSIDKATLTDTLRIVSKTIAIMRTAGAESLLLKEVLDCYDALNNIYEGK
jgi:hypothetical protein